jgi:ribonuclease HI
VAEDEYCADPAAVSLDDLISSGDVKFDLSGESDVGESDCAVWTDGACNLGHSASGYVIKRGSSTEKSAWPMGDLRTPYAAEQCALVGALGRVGEFDGSGLVVFNTDAQGLVAEVSKESFKVPARVGVMRLMIRKLVQNGWKVVLRWVPRGSNQEADRFVKEARRELQIKRAAGDAVVEGDAPLLTVKEICSLVGRRLKAEKTEILKQRAADGSDTLGFLCHFTNFAPNPVVKAKSALGRAREVQYSKIRMNRFFHIPGDDCPEFFCPGCFAQRPELPHYYCCEDLEELRGDLSLGSLTTEPGNHLQFLSEVKSLAEEIASDWG